MYERFSDRARKVMQFAQESARATNHEYVGTGDILLGLAKEDLGVASHALNAAGVCADAVRAQIDAIVEAEAGPTPTGKLPLTARAKLAVANAVKEAEALGGSHVGTEHLLLGLLRETQGVAAQVMRNLGVPPEKLREEVMALLGPPKKSPVEAIADAAKKDPDAVRIAAWWSLALADGEPVAFATGPAKPGDRMGAGELLDAAALCLLQGTAGRFDCVDVAGIWAAAAAFVKARPQDLK